MPPLNSGYANCGLLLRRPVDAAAVAAKRSVRAGLCEDPKDYRWCGYAEALGGSKRARRGLCRVMGRALDCLALRSGHAETALLLRRPVDAAAVAAKHSWEQRAAKALTTGAEWYRGWLFEEGREQRDEDGRLQRRGLDRKTVEKVKEGGGKLSRPQLLRCRVR